VKIVESQNGGTAAQLGADAGAGGYGGVGGPGVGGPVDPGTATVLGAAPAGNGSAQGLAWLYPYDGTVWPRGLLAPLLQWSWTGGAIDGIAIHLQTKSGLVVYDAMFAPPAGLGGGAFVDAPIPQDAWSAATNSASGGETLSVSLTVASGGAAYGPLTQTWTVAPARLSGTLYYNAYLTDLLTNSDFNALGRYWGAAIMGIHVGETNPVVVAGTDDPPGSPHGTGCRACHSVASNGATLIAQQGLPDNSPLYPWTSIYNLLAGNAETPLTAAPYSEIFGWAALSPDGTLAVTTTAALASQNPATQVWAFPPSTGGTSTPLTGTGLDGSGVLISTPAFSPDGKHIAFTLSSATLPSAVAGGNGQPDTQVVVMDVNGTTFSNARAVFTLSQAQPGPSCVGFASFTPDNQAVIVQLQVPTAQYPQASCGASTYGAYMGTMGIASEIWWAPLAAGGMPMRLNALNGRNAGGNYLPTGLNHPDDTTLNYEPTVNPVLSGGYAWVVFTSRRMYGNIATGDPMGSDPQRGFDPTMAITPKKLWVAAIDLSAQTGTQPMDRPLVGPAMPKDPSFPPFYLPAQELHAANSRGFWVLDPCAKDGQSCMSGDQCCGGFCEPNDAGMLVCGTPPPGTCAGTGEKCNTSADCCDSAEKCIDGFCALPAPPQ
jgi:hypothetical protein